MVNIVDALKGYVTAELVSKAANMLGEDASGITKAASSLIPTVLGGLLNKSTDTSAFGSIFDMLKDPQNDSWLDNLGGLIGGGNLAKGDPKDAAGSLMGSLFGSKVGGIIDLVSSVAGVKKSSSSSLMGMVGPLVMSYLGRKIRKEGLDAFGLSKFLGRQAPNIAAALPAGMGDLIGFAKGAGDSVSRATANAATTKHVESGSTGGGNKWLWPLLLAALAASVFYFTKGCETPDVPKVDVTEQMDKVKDAAGDAAGTVANAAENVVDAASDAAGTLGAFFKKKLACGIELNIPENGIEAQVVTFIEDESKAIDKETWFNFDRLTFATGSANLDMAKSEEQLDNISEIMKCYPNAKIKIGGYTDNTGNEAANMTLSQNRANNVMAALVAKGVAAERMEAEGYGIAHPIATNDTEEGRAQNRRIAMRLTAK